MAGTRLAWAGGSRKHPTVLPFGAGDVPVGMKRGPRVSIRTLPRLGWWPPRCWFAPHLRGGAVRGSPAPPASQCPTSSLLVPTGVWPAAEWCQAGGGCGHKTHPNAPSPSPKQGSLLGPWLPHPVLNCTAQLIPVPPSLGLGAGGCSAGSREAARRRWAGASSSCATSGGHGRHWGGARGWGRGSGLQQGLGCGAGAGAELPGTGLGALVSTWCCSLLSWPALLLLRIAAARSLGAFSASNPSRASGGGDPGPAPAPFFPSPARRKKQRQGFLGHLVAISSFYYSWRRQMR